MPQDIDPQLKNVLLTPSFRPAVTLWNRLEGRARKEESLAKLRDPSTPTPVLRVRAADALFNARSIVTDLRRHGPETWQRFHAGAVDQLWYHRSLAIVLAHRHPGLLSDELRATVGEMEQLAGWWFDVGDPRLPIVAATEEQIQAKVFENLIKREGAFL